MVKIMAVEMMYTVMTESIAASITRNTSAILSSIEAPCDRLSTSAVDLPAQSVTSHESEHRAYAFAAQCHVIGYRFIQLARCLGIRNGCDGLVDKFEIFVERFHDG